MPFGILAGDADQALYLYHVAAYVLSVRAIPSIHTFLRAFGWQSRDICDVCQGYTLCLLKSIACRHLEVYFCS